MPLMTNPESGQLRIVPGRSRSIYEQRGWELAPPPASEAPEQPAVNDPKSDWVAYAASQGVDPDGMTKAELIDTVGA